MKTLLVLLFIFISCESPPQRAVSSYHGVVSYDPESNCSQEVLEYQCKDELEESKSFKARCLSQNRKILVCDCDDYLCVDKNTN